MADFTIRFKSEFDTGNNQLVVGCDKYNTYLHPTGVVEVTVYPTVHSDIGVKYYVGSDEAITLHESHFGEESEYFQVAFVSNSNSKTIDKIS